MAEFEQRNPVSVLYEWCQVKGFPVPAFTEEKASVNEFSIPSFNISVTVNGVKYHSLNGSSKVDGKAKAAVSACDALGLYHTGVPIKSKKVCLKGRPAEKNSTSLLYELCQSYQWPEPTICTVKESGSSHTKHYVVRYIIGNKLFPCGAGQNKDTARKRAAARALSRIKKVPVREIMLGPDPNKAFGTQVAEYSWEAFGILCEELGKDFDSCRRSNLSCFLLEDTQDGSLRVVSMGTGYNVAKERYRVCNGETVIDCHSVVVARRGLLVFMYEQLLKLLDEKDSIFEYSSKAEGKVCKLNERYQLHLYMKDAPCGNATFGKCGYDKLQIKDHQMYFDKERQSTSFDDRITVKCECPDIASCSDKILLWNFVGLQGSLLGKFIPGIYLNSITITNDYAPGLLVRAFCCRYRNDIINHPWLHYGDVAGIEKTITHLEMRKSKWSVYWTHGVMDLSEALIGLPSNGGIIDGITGTHCSASERDGEIPIICKRNLFRLFKKVLDRAGSKIFQASRTYADHKNRSVEYKRKKNEFFQHINAMKLGQFPLIDRNIDAFTLLTEDLHD